ncbi:tyrosine protein phosphatase [Allomyces arbusculus]|nr:tyrosine protein phosphatase [Allomyces arbusculus]
MTARKVYVVGVGMTRFEKPGKRDDFDYPEMAREAATKALLDANVTYDRVQAAYVGYCYGDSTAGQRALYPLGMTGIPIVNVNNNCSTGSAALFLARNAIEAGQADCAMALGFEKMAPGSLGSVWTDRENPLAPHVMAIASKTEMNPKVPIAPMIFCLGAMEYCAEHGVTDEAAQRRVLATIAHKNHLHSTLNPYSQFRDDYSVEQIEKSRKVMGPLNMLACCPTSDGSACAILASEAFVRAHGLEAQAIEIAGMAMRTDVVGDLGDVLGTAANGRANPDAAPESVSFQKIAGAHMSQLAAEAAMREAGVTPRDIRVVELHDCFAANELMMYDALGFTSPQFSAVDMVRSMQRTPGTNAVVAQTAAGTHVTVNPSGGLLSKGHPLGATGIAQCAELSWQLRGWCGPRQVTDNGSELTCALQHNVGLGGAAVVTVYRKPAAFSSKKADPTARVGYNPAVEARGVSDEDVARVRARPAAKL